VHSNYGYEKPCLLIQPQQTPIAVAQKAVLVGKGVVVDIFPG